MLSNILLSMLSPHIDEITGIITVGFDVTNQLLIRKPMIQLGRKLNGTHQLLVYADDINLLGNGIDTKQKK
jgi:hypothetical protein